MKYFLHDTNSFDDEKIRELFDVFGYEGLGLFYTALEKLGAQEKPIKTSVLKSQLNVGKRLERCWSFMESLGILSSSDGYTFNKQLLNYSEKYKIKKEKNRERISEWRDKQQVTETVTHYESVRNIDKVKESKVKLSKENINNNAVAISFGNYHKKYPGTKRSLETELNNFLKKTKDSGAVAEILLQRLEAQIENRERKKRKGEFVPEWKNMSTYINNRCWEEGVTIEIKKVDENGWEI